ncbi:MAG: EscU/YscU/HrcU family type III secretion system export apparatus switch protein [Peptococcaceae bacterium]|nr:EscU/YscU/HrcU family type III secretion system export apparatus switch protein [Peptococcaceae bacterium]
MAQDQIKKAVALIYDREQDNAPRIIASGRGELAEQILAVAHKADIPVQQNKLLVEALLKCEVNTAIPPELYQAVAEVLAMVYKLEQHNRSSF